MRWPILNLSDVLRARATIAPYMKPTPTLQSAELAEEIGCERVYVKCENLTPTGAFKVRGGINIIATLSPETRARGVLAVSTGNHAQSVAFAARLFGVRAVIFMPEQANPLKVAATKRLGAEVTRAGADFDECREAAQCFCEESGLHYIHSADEPMLVAGVATATLELLETAPDIEVLFVPVGGGSGVLGAAIVARAVNPALQVIGVQSEGAPAVYESWKQGKRIEYPSLSTFAEGLATRQPFDLPLQWLPQLVRDMRLVSDAEIKAAMLLLLRTTRQVAEGAGAATTAAAMKYRSELAGKRVGLMLSGGNVPLEQLREILGLVAC
jgi:threonine dehydratase